MAEFREEARLWVAANVAPFVPATMITHVLAGDDVLSMAGGSNSSVPSASPPTSLAPPSGGLTPPVGSSPPSDFGPPPTGFGPPAGGFGPPTGFGPPSAFGPPGSFNGSGTFGPSGTLEPYGIGCRHVASLAASTLVSAVVLAVLVASPDLM
ncbi:unnamed protein product [Triticum turgidum subsp. durum]|uniref:Uncharacterized protein n=1 Tax=Triticum turgidum subsp. durum TaxID=4567 RepID=A0A9R0TCC8_TRITD|nr:unnamed protein product [Triticum turgidum subsp. durum]